MVFEWLDLLENPCWVFVNCTMLFFIYKYSAPLNSNTQNVNKEKFLLVFNATQESFLAMEKRQKYRIEVEKAKKKQKIYAEIADH